MSWSRDHDCCVSCKSTERKHQSKGRCERCYNRDRHSARTEYKRAWAQANRNLFLSYNRAYRQKFRKERGNTSSARWFKGVQVKDSLFGVGFVQGPAKREGREWTVPVKFAQTTLEMPTRELTRTGYWE